MQGRPVAARSLLDRWTYHLALAVLLAPVAVAVVRALGSEGVAINGDVALIELRVRDVGVDTPLLGSYQRFGWNQPGPLLHYWLAVPYRLLGSDFAGLQVGALLLNAAALALVVRLAMVADSRAAGLWAVVVVAALVRAMGPHLSDPWEPYLTVVPLVALILVTAEALRDARWLPVVAVTASLIAQALTSMAPIALGLLGVAAVAASWRAWRGTGATLRGAVRRPLPLTGALLLAAWAPPLAHEVTSDTSNVGRMWEFFRTPHEVLGMTDSLRSVALQFGVRPPWLTGEARLEPFVGTVALPDLPVVAAAVVVVLLVLTLAPWRSGRWTPLGVVSALALVLTVLSLASLVGPLFDWVLNWSWAVAAALWIAGGSRVLALLDDRHRASGAVQGGLLAILLVLSISSTRDVLEAVPPPDRIRDAVQALRVRAAAAVAHLDGPVRISADMEIGEFFDVDETGVAHLALALERQGVRTVVDAALANRFGAHRVDEGDSTAELKLVTAGGAPGSGRSTVIAVVDPLSDDDRAELRRIDARLQELGVAERTVATLPAGSPDFVEMATLLGHRNELAGYPQIALVLAER